MEQDHNNMATKKKTNPKLTCVVVVVVVCVNQEGVCQSEFIASGKMIRAIVEQHGNDM